jgi:FMN phosphatase YigB (HAD superfamily)
VEPALAKLIDATVGNINLSSFQPASPIIRQGLQLREQGIAIAILTNGVRANVFKVLAAKGLTDICPREWVFDAISTRDAAGKLHPKPDPEGCRRVLTELGIAPAACVFVDNSRKNARSAKRKVGCRGVIYVGSRRKPKDQGIIDYLTPSFDALMGDVVAAFTRRT